MGLLFLCLFWTAAIGIVLALLNFYKNPRTISIWIGATVFIGFLFPFSIAFDLPIDVSSGGSEETCLKPFLYVKPVILHYIWLLTYWNSYLLTWFIVPFLQGYVDSGEFGVIRRTLDSLKANIKFYIFSVAIFVVLTLYLLLSTNAQTLQGAVGFVMAVGNAWGLTMAMAFLGHGLIQLPRALWKSADQRRSLSRLEYMAPKVKEQLVDAQADLDEVVSEIQALHRRQVTDPILNSLIDELLSTSPLPEIDFANGLETGAIREHGPMPVITREYLTQLNYRAKEAVAHRGSSESKWNSLVHKAIHLQDVITNERYNSGYAWTSSLKNPHRYKWVRFLQWLWYVKIDSLTRRLLAILAVGMSVIIISSELSLVSTTSDYSIISWVIHWKYLTPTIIEFFTLAILLYLATCTYNSFMKVRIFRYYLLVPHHSDEKSLLFFAGYFCRLAFPIGYNYLTLIQGPTRNQAHLLITEFSKVMGPMDLIPVLGQNFNYYFSVGLFFVCALVFFRMHGWVSQLFSSDPNLSFEDFHIAEEEHFTEGRELINAARRQEERSRNRSNDLGIHSSSWVSRLSNDNSTFELR